MSTGRWSGCPGSPSRSTAGKGTTSPASRTTGEAIGGGLAVTGNYPGKARTPDELRVRPREGLCPDPRHAPAQPARQLRRDRRPARRARRAPPRALPRLDRLGAGSKGLGTRLQPDLLRPPEGRRRLDARPPRRRDPPVLDRARHRLPADRRGDRPGAGHALRHQRLDSRRLRRTRPSTARGRASGSPVARRGLRRADRPAVQPRRGREQAVRPRLRVVRRRLARVLPRLRRHPQEDPLPRRRPLPPDRGHLRQDLGRADLARRGPPARQPGRALGQRPRRHPQRRAARDRAGGRPRRLPRPGPHRPRLLRREHQPRRRLGDRHASMLKAPC